MRRSSADAATYIRLSCRLSKKRRTICGVQTIPRVLTHDPPGATRLDPARPGLTQLDPAPLRMTVLLGSCLITVFQLKARPNLFCPTVTHCKMSRAAIPTSALHHPVMGRPIMTRPLMTRPTISRPTVCCQTMSH